MKLFVIFFLILFIVAFSSLANVSAFETHGGPGAVYPWLSTIIIGDHLGLPVHQEITKEGLSFLNDATKTLLADQHIYMEGDQSSSNHFDNCAFSESIAKINYKYRIAVGYLNPDFPQPDKSAEEFGRLLHIVQDFYSHSNWVEMRRTNLVDQGYSYWNDIPFFSLSTGDNPVFSFEVQKDTKTNNVLYSKYANKVIRVKLGDNNYQDIGLISGTYGEPEENKCLPGTSVPHGSSVGPYFSFADNEKLNKPDALNKDHPKQKGHATARDIAVKQTEHEFCRLVELTRTQWHEKGVDIIYENWVKNTNIAISKCPIIEKSSTIITDSNTSIGSVQEFLIPNWVKQNAKWWSDGITSDKEFANTMGFLVKEKIISVNIPMNNDGSILVNDNLQIPNWLRNNAKWWSDGTIQDSDFTSGVEYMIKEKVITFSEKKIVPESKIIQKQEPIKTVPKQDKNQIEIIVLKINDKYYPLSQFTESNNQSHLCNESYFEALNVYSKDAQVRSIDGSFINVKQDGCKFGKVSETKPILVKVTQEQLDTYTKDWFAIGNLTDKLLKKYGLTKGSTPMDFTDSNYDKKTSNKDNTVVKETKNGNTTIKEYADGTIVEKYLNGTVTTRSMIFNSETTIYPDGTIIRSERNANGELVTTTRYTNGTSIKILDGITSITYQSGVNYSKTTYQDGTVITHPRSDTVYRITEFVNGTKITESRGGEMTTEYSIPKSEIKTNINDPETSQQPQQQGPPVKWIVAEIINGEYYPWAQFKIGYPGDTCNDRHVFSVYPKVRSLNGVYLTNPDPNHIGCGFGSASIFNEVEDYPITQAQIDSFKADMGFEP